MPVKLLPPPKTLVELRRPPIPAPVEVDPELCLRAAVMEEAERWRARPTAEPTPVRLRAASGLRHRRRGLGLRVQGRG